MKSPRIDSRQRNCGVREHRAAMTESDDRDSPDGAAKPQTTELRLRDRLLGTLRRADDWIHERIGPVRILFVSSEAYGFSCQAPVIRALRDYPKVVVRVTVPPTRGAASIDCADNDDLDVFQAHYMPPSRARYAKWHMVVSAHLNSFHPVRQALRVYMHHGPGFGIMGTKSFVASKCDVFLGLSNQERIWFERASPGLFGPHRAFFPIGFPKTDGLVNRRYDRARVLANLRLPDRPTILIASHWKPYGLLRSLGEEPCVRLAASFPDFNVIQTGHPWLWEGGHDIDPSWQQAMQCSLAAVAGTSANARFAPTSFVEPLLAASDVLVADQSSVLTSYSLLDRPILFFDNPEFSFANARIGDLYRSASIGFADSAPLPGAVREALASPSVLAPGRRALRDFFFANPGCAASVAARTLVGIGALSSTRSPQWPRITRLSAS